MKILTILCLNLPILAICLAYGLIQWRGKWRPVRWITLGLVFMVMCTNLFPIPGMDKLTSLLSPGGLFHPYLDDSIPNTELIKTIQETSPYQVSNLGVIVNTDFLIIILLIIMGKLPIFRSMAEN